MGNGNHGERARVIARTRVRRCPLSWLRQRRIRTSPKPREGSAVAGYRGEVTVQRDPSENRSSGGGGAEGRGDWPLGQVGGANSGHPILAQRSRLVLQKMTNSSSTEPLCIH